MVDGNPSVIIYKFCKISPFFVVRSRCAIREQEVPGRVHVVVVSLRYPFASFVPLFFSRHHPIFLYRTDEVKHELRSNGREYINEEFMFPLSKLFFHPHHSSAKGHTHPLKKSLYQSRQLKKFGLDSFD